MQAIKAFALFLAIVALSELASAKDYCHVKTCKDEKHTACVFKAKEKPKCSNLIDHKLKKHEIERIVASHNKLRKRIADGLETEGKPGPQPAAKKMATLEWDHELAYIAQIWANQCKFEHDKCRDTHSSYVGQNIAISGTTADVDSIEVESLVKMWYDEVKLFDKNQIYKPYSFEHATGHYTQLVWAKTTKVGCGAVKYNDGKFNQFLLVCNYATGGNIIGQRIYEHVEE